MSTNILFVFEGARTEDMIVRSLKEYILSNEDLIITCVFGTDIYQLYREIEKDEDFDTFNLIKERNAANKIKLKDYNRNNFAEIYLFFDYDAHASLAGATNQYGNEVKEGDEKLKEMLSFFDNETEKGKLYISYPMTEALKHIVCFETFYELTAKCKGHNCKYKDDCDKKDECMSELHYKAIVNQENIPHLRDIDKYTKEIWKELIIAHLSKMNYIVNSLHKFPQKIEFQQDIFEKQLDKFINKKCPVVSVLSAFPVFVHDYFGNEKTKKLLH
ncbi:MAG: hypothetical protein FWC10_04045 [Lentimicrobiaceae bacterium]|nr:hypothetical protein [Lentimicrobiaceae bacterium]